jgi:hypothetical protein
MCVFVLSLVFVHGEIKTEAPHEPDYQLRIEEKSGLFGTGNWSNTMSQPQPDSELDIEDNKI